ncbi:MAG: GNA1162 family protein [Nitrospirota bacterium]
MRKRTIPYALISVMIMLTACSVSRQVPLYCDVNNPLKRVAVLPMRNDTADVEGPDVVRKKMVKALERRSYVVMDIKATDQILRDQMGITLGGQLDMTTPQELGKTLDVEGILYGTLMDFDEVTTGAYNVRKVRAKFKLVNTQTGVTLFQQGLGVKSEVYMKGKAGGATAVVAKIFDSRDNEVPWITLYQGTTGTEDITKSFAISLGVKLITKAIGIHLDYESTQLVERISSNVPWGPGSFGISSSKPVNPNAPLKTF